MFCADYIASFIHHGILTALWFEYQKVYGKKENLSSAYVPPLQSACGGCLAGETRKQNRHDSLLTVFSSQGYSEPPQFILWTLFDREQ